VEAVFIASPRAAARRIGVSHDTDFCYDLLTVPQLTTVTAYLASLPEDRRKAISQVRTVIRKNLPAGYREVMCAGMITYEVPLKVYPDTYNGHALWYAAIGAQKNYLTLYLMNAYGTPALTKKLQDGFKAAGKKLDMGKACIRFQAAEDLALETVGEVVASTSLEQFVASAKSVRNQK
jgi:hypothetical protein